MRIIITGLVGQYAFGGVAWDYLQYVGGFQQLGHEVLYLEDTEMWPYDPVNATITDDCTYNVNYLRTVMERFGLGDRWCYRNAANGTHHGVSTANLQAFCRAADLFVNVSGCGWMRPEYTTIPHRVFIDSDPLFAQINAQTDHLRAHNHHFTFAENIGGRGCRIPDLDLEWTPTRQPIVLDWWPVATQPPRPVWTTVMNWVSYKPVTFEGETWGQKDIEFQRFIDLPGQTDENFEIACGLGPGKTRPTESLLAHGWQVVEPDEKLPDPWSYRDYLASSKGEWSVAKEGYVKSRSGWFSCRSACYLALGRPCVLQDTGWSDHYPTGDGLLAFTTPAEAVEALATVAADYAHHCHEARELAATHFDARRVLAALLEEVSTA